MNEKEAREIIDGATIPHIADPYQIERYWIAKGFLAGIESRDEIIKKVGEALDDIVNLHEKGLEEIENKRGFLGWTCCSQKERIAGQALALIEKKAL